MRRRNAWLWRSCFAGANNCLDFYLTVPHHREQGRNVTAARADADARFRSAVEMVRDENTGAAEKPVQVAHKNFRLLPESESREGLSVLPVARITRTPAGVFDLDNGFVPPLLDLGASNYLTTIARRLVEILAARSTALSGTRRQKGQTLAELSAAEIPNFWLLYNINTWLPVFRHLHEGGNTHPEALFSAMTALTGSLTAFSDQVHPRDLAPYDHEKLGECFSSLDENLRFLLENAAPRNFVSLPLKLVKPSIYAASIDDDRYLRSTRLYLAVRSGANQSGIAEKVPKLVKVGSANHIDHMVRQALPGVGLTNVPIPPGAVPVKLDFEYFSLQQSGPEWDAVVRGRNLAAYMPAEIPNPELELVILLS